VRAPSPNFRQLKAFLAIAKLGSFRRAAEALHVSQPALTVQIRELELALAVRLLDRNTRGVALTQAGRQLLPTLERLLGELDAVLHDTRALSERRRGLVTIAALPSISATVLPEAIARFRQTYPGITVKLKDCVAARVVELVKAGDVDFGISSLPRTDPDIRVTPLMNDRLGAVFPAGHPLERRRSVQLKDLQSYPLILMESGSSVRSMVDRALEEVEPPIVPAYEAAYISTALGMVKAGLGITILPSSSIEFEGARGLRSRPIAHAALTRAIGILERSGRTSSPATEAFIESLQALASRT
jgi:LysR family transcriptional regulator, carnitine catabolism transcriptional activator